MLSRGNGLLESLSFLAIILGTVFGGVLSDQFRGREYVIGAILFGLALIGSVASLLIRKMPAANPDRGFPPLLYKPLWENIRVLLKSRPLAFAVLGIAFFTFIVAFMRATVYMHGESQIPRWSESHTSMIVGMVALGIGLGSPLVGFLSGGKVELGLLPIGAVGMIVAAVVAALSLQFVPGLVACIILIGFFTGFYIVPLFTLLQHRAPKTSKGDSIATSNFINVTGAILASLVFFGMDWAARKTGLAPELPQEDVGLLAKQMNLHVLAAQTVTSFMRPQLACGMPQLLTLKRVQDAFALGPRGRRIREIEYREGRPYKVILGRSLREIEEGPGDAIEVKADSFIDAFKTPLKPGDRVIESVYRRGRMTHHRLRREEEPLTPVYDKQNMPRLLFLSAGGMTLATLLLLWWQMPDLFRRTGLWFHWLRRCRLEPVGLHHLPSDGPVLLVTNAKGEDGCRQVLCATDRRTSIISAARSGEVARTLRHGGVVLMPAGDAEEAAKQVQCTPAPVLPVWVEIVPDGDRPRVYVVFGPPVAEQSAAAIDEALRQTGVEFRTRFKGGALAVQEKVAGMH